MNRLLLALALSLPVVTLVSCGNATVSTPAPPNSPQAQALNLTKLLADSINAGVKTGIALRDQGKFTQANNLILQDWAKSAIALDDQIAAELASGESWTVQKKKILLILPKLKVPTMSGIDPGIQTMLAGITTLISQIQAQVSQ